MEVAVKATFIRKETTEVRRFSGKFDWDGLTTVIAHLWGGNAPKSYSVEYTDEEGDNIRLGSDMEWKECVRILNTLPGSRVLRLTIKRVKKDDKHVPRPTPVAAEEPAPVVAAVCRDVPEIDDDEMPVLEDSVVSVVAEEAPKPAVPALNTSAIRQPEAPMYSPGAPDEQAEPVFNLLSVLFECDAKNELLNPCTRFDFSPVARILHLNGEVDVDLNQDALRSLAITSANAAMDCHAYARAASILAVAVDVYPLNKVVRYNLACAHALQNNKQAALHSLSEAIKLGYNDVDQLAHDEDLNNIRTEVQFIALVAQLEGPAVAITAAASTSPDSDFDFVESPVPAEVVVVAPAPAAPAAPQLQYPAEVEKMLSIFPDLDSAVADEVLKAHNGNVRSAINTLFA